MPGCPPSCPIVKRQLKIQAAEKQKKLQAERRPPDKNEEEETSEDNIPDEEPSPADFNFGDRELESDHDSRENERRTEDEVRRMENNASLDEKSSRSARSGGSERRSSRYSEHDLSEKSTRRNGDHGGYEPDRSEHCDTFKDNPCSSECRSRRLRVKKMRRKLAKQKAVDGGMNYFSNLCNCSFTCLIDQLWKDPFVRKIIRSAALFAVGIKLCYEMDAWYIPTP